MNVKTKKTTQPRTVSLACPKCGRNLGAWETFDADEGGPDRAGPTLDALMRRGVRMDTPESGSVTFDCPDPGCSWRQVVPIGDVEEVVYWGAINGEPVVGLTGATLWEASRRRSERAPLSGGWIEAPTTSSRISPRYPDYLPGVASILSRPAQPLTRASRRIGRHAS